MGISKFLFANKKRKRLSIIIFIVILTTIVSYFLDQWGNQPSSVAINIPTTSNDNSVSDYQALLTPYFKTKIPPNFRVQPSINVANSSRYYVIAESNSNDILISFLSENLSIYGLSAVPGYYMRETNPDNYHIIHNPLLLLGSTTFMSSVGGSGYTSFITHNGRYVAISISDGIPTDLLNILVNIMNSWSWT